MKIYVAAVEALRKKGETGCHSVYHQNWWKNYKTIVFSLCKIFIPSYTFDVLLCRNWPFLSPNHETLQITLLSKKNFGGSLRIKTSHYSISFTNRAAFDIADCSDKCRVKTEAVGFTGSEGPVQGQA